MGRALIGRRCSSTSLSDWKWDDSRERGYFADIREYTATRGVVVSPMNAMLSSRHGIPLPMIMCRSLEERFEREAPLPEITPLNGRTTLMGLSFRESGRQALSTWIQPFMATSPSRKQYVEVCAVEGRTHRFLLRYVLRSSLLAKLEPAETSLVKAHLYSFVDLVDEFQALGVRNRLAGYVFLIDSQGRIRWRASGKLEGPVCDMFTRFANELDDEIAQ
ncbi:hypothetical protein PBRA_005727 [Plasmodiophora brassicae]|nr:hypothetical protein PBRA_005727 [Plasmodiophora brassicae]